MWLVGGVIANGHSRQAKAGQPGKLRSPRRQTTAPAPARDARAQKLAAAMEAEAYRRAVKGVLKPVVQQGRVVARVRLYSDSLLALLLKAHAPEKYREHAVTIANHVQTGAPPELIEALRAANATNQRLVEAFQARRRRPQSAPQP
jgi:hypothetical protein